MADPLTITINGQQYEVGSDVSASTRLASFLKAQGLPGTHTTCYEGGCGACIVVASVTSPATGKKMTQAVNSCLVPVLGCLGWEVTTVEGLGNRFDGYHVIQERLADYNGTQCGYCSPGMVMSMYGLTQSQASWTPEEVEHHLDGSICRCTGYRPILDAFKSITVQDIEDWHSAPCPRTGLACKGDCRPHQKAGGKVACQQRLPRTLQVKGATWHEPSTLQELYDTLAALPDGTLYTLVSGNTGQAVFSPGSINDYIYTRHIPDLSQVKVAEDGLVFGANVSISEVMANMETAASTYSAGYAYLLQLVQMWRYLASTSLRNMSSWAGNLALKVAHPDFPSDLFVGLLGAGATITTAGTDGVTATHTVEELLQVDLKGERRVILEMSLPPMAEDEVFRVFKVTPRVTNSVAYVNAAFRLRVDQANAHTVLDTPVIVYGGISPNFVRATATEAALAGQSLEDEATLQSAFTALASEVVPLDDPAASSPEYRLALTQNLLYKTVLGIIGAAAGASVASGATVLQRPLSSGQQIFDPNSDVWPLAEAVPKLEAKIQCSGEAEYVSTVPTQPGEAVGMFVTSTEANARIVSIDASAALEVPGVLAFLGAADITGQNNIKVFAWSSPEPLFPEERVLYYGQPLGVLVATDRGAASAGLSAMKVTYDDIQPPVLTIQEALKLPLPPDQYPPIEQGDVQAGFAASSTIIEGSVSHDSQYHFHMESQVCLATPTDIGLDILSSSQWASETQKVVGQVLNLPDNKINVTVKRIGGGFGGKIDRCNIIASAAALAAQKVRRPVRISLDLSTNMTAIGWREPFLCTYKVGVDDAGLLQAVEATLTSDAGSWNTPNSSAYAAFSLPSCYTCPNWLLTPQYVLTNTAANTACRSPGTVEGITFMENIMDQVADVLGVDPLQFRQQNLLPDGGSRKINKGVMRLRSHMTLHEMSKIPEEIIVPRNLLSDMIEQIKVTADVESRKTDITQFNKENLWKKRGLAVMPMLWPYGVNLVMPFSAMVAVDAHDGTVTISHGGTEMGQGINTKTAQCAAYELGVPLEYVSVMPTTTHTNPNSTCTGGSTGSDTASYVVAQACKMIKERLEAVKEAMGGGDVSWQELVLTAYNQGVDISQRYVNGVDEVKGYSVFGVACTEVELDLLTGQYLVLRTDILEDAGRSLSPLVDIGQVEGAFIMGQGLFLTEQPLYNPSTGQRLTDSTWNYKPPMALDIPVDLRVTFLQNAPNPIGVLSSKVTAEPPLSLAYSIIMALRQALTSARLDAGTPGWFQMDAPLTVEKLQRLALVDPNRLTLN
ncbi:xanthine dehydrogenase/oxidase-like [Procambarus clarkii]|uniref:xanthine dehydrogenase/oxidase-like n=1 Tax=Procambarus clarkii TaxID=6728 RepID=UPI003743114B